MTITTKKSSSSSTKCQQLETEKNDVTKANDIRRKSVNDAVKIYPENKSQKIC